MTQKSVLMFFLRPSPSTCLPICLRPGGGRAANIGRQVEGLPLFGCDAAGARGIQYKYSVSHLDMLFLSPNG